MFLQLRNKDLVVLSCFHKTITRLMRSNDEEEKDFIKIRNFQLYSG